MDAVVQQKLLNDRELAARWGMSPKTLRNKRVAGTKVPFLKLGGLVRYRMEDILAYEEQQKVGSTSERPLLKTRGGRRNG